MADDAEQAIMNLGRHDLHIGTDAAPQSRNLPKCSAVGFFRRRQHATMVYEEVRARRLGTPLFTAGNWMSGNKGNVFRQRSFHAAHDLTFDAADIADNTARLDSG